MEKKEFIVHISDEGDTSIRFDEGKGYGKKCVEITKFLEEAIGEVKSRTYNKDYYRPLDKDVIVNVL